MHDKGVIIVEKVPIFVYLRFCDPDAKDFMDTVESLFLVIGLAQDVGCVLSRLLHRSVSHLWHVLA